MDVFGEFVLVFSFVLVLVGYPAWFGTWWGAGPYSELRTWSLLLVGTSAIVGVRAWVYLASQPWSFFPTEEERHASEQADRVFLGITSAALIVGWSGVVLGAVALWRSLRSSGDPTSKRQAN